MSRPVIRVDGLSKAYRIGLRDEVADTFISAVSRCFKSPLKNLRKLKRLNTFAGDGADGEDVLWALKDVSFEVNEGDVVGVVGRNGAGKSTLLKILSRITEPTAGSARIRGRVSSLLEVGTGFHPELTGRENIYMNGTILGMMKREIDRKFDEIVEFSGVSKFLDTPVKRYSSGMQVRLAFAVAAHLEPEILIVDEVLAVGDVGFQQKCIGKMEDVASGGRTVLFVSHNMAAVESLCTRAVRLDHGSVTMDSSVRDVVDSYLHESSEVQCGGNLRDLERPTGMSVPLMTRLSVLDEAGQQISAVPLGGSLRLDVEVDAGRIDEEVSLSIGVVSPRGDVLFRCNSARQCGKFVSIDGPAVLSCLIKDVRLVPGKYGLRIALQTRSGALDKIESGLGFVVDPRDIYGTARLPPVSANYGYFVPNAVWTVRQGNASDEGVAGKEFAA